MLAGLKVQNRGWAWSRGMEGLMLVALLGIAAFLRFYRLEVSPAWEWDETVYKETAANLLQLGYPAFKPEAGQNFTPYLFHPPFYFYLLAGWFKLFGVGILQARTLAATASVIFLVMTYFAVRDMGGRTAALITLLLLSFDGWLTYSNHVSWIENTAVLFIVGGVWLYHRATTKAYLQHPAYLWFGLAGTVIGMGAIYKHIAVYVILVPILNLLITRRNFRGHTVLFAGTAAVISLYALGMYLCFGDNFLNQSLVQFNRSTGKVESRGLNYGAQEAISAFVSRYWIFVGLVVCLGICGVLIAIRSWGLVRKLRQPGQENQILLCWALSAALFLGLLSLKSPHYWMLALVPLYCFLGVEGTKLVLGSHRKNRKALLYGYNGLLVVLFALGLFAYQQRLLVDYNDTTVEYAQWVSTNVAPNARIMTEETLGAVVQQPYIKIWRAFSADSLRQWKPDYLVIYTSTTQSPPTTKALNNLLDKSAQVAQFKGFKETITVFKINPQDLKTLA